jgi:HEAT repeat protein
VLIAVMPLLAQSPDRPQNSGVSPRAANQEPEAQSPDRPQTSGVGPQAHSPEPRAQSLPSRESLDAAINRLGAFDYTERAKASQAVRRAPGTIALPALIDAASSHADGYVRYRALVLLSGYDDPRVADQMEQAALDANDRLRAVAYGYFERHPDPRLVPSLLKGFDKELAEFVRPALVRALAAHGTDPRVQAALVKDVTRGQDFFRSSVIEALGEYKATYALAAITGVAQLEGPLQDDAVLALGQIGDKASIPVLAGLQRKGSRELQPALATAICLLGSNCDVHRGFLIRTLTFADKTPGFQELLRAAAAGLGALATHGDVEAGHALFDVGIPAMDPTRAPVALALAGVTVRQPMRVIGWLAEQQDRAGALELLREGFDMLEEDFGEEQCFITIRKAYFAEPEGSPKRALIQAVINKLEF